MDLFRYIDLGTILMVVGLCAVWAVIGFNVCKMRHRQHGIAVDEDFKVPDFVPEDFVDA